MSEALTAQGTHCKVIYNVDQITSEQLTDWGNQPDCTQGPSLSRGILLHKGPDNKPESGFWECTPGSWPLSIPRDEFCHFLQGEAIYTLSEGEVIDVSAGTCVHFNAGWTGNCLVNKTLRNVYMLTAEMPSTTQQEKITVTPVLHNPHELNDVTDWGTVPTMIDGVSSVSGVLLHKGPNGESETGVWICTPGYWNCHVTSDEFCHFIEGRATYVHESGEVIEITPNTSAFFPEGWRGTCHVHETIRKTYMIR